MQINLKDIPTSPGIYMFIDAKDRIIYVGKAKSLRQRLASYFNAGTKTIKTTRMLENAVRVRTIVTTSEVEALLLESNLIKTELPRYNILLKDSKGYPYVKLTGEEYPRLIYTRNTSDKEADYFGPFVNAGELREILDFLKDIFPLRTCGNSQLKLGKICLKYQIHKCLGPCEGLISKEDYAALVDEVRHFFRGEVAGVKSHLKEQMKEYSDAMRYEEAARVRDRLSALERHFARQQTVEINEKRSLDLFYRHEIKNTVGVTQLFVRGGLLLGAKTYFFSPDEDDLLERFIMQFYSNVRQFPDMIAAEGGELSDTVAEALSAMAERKIILRKRGYGSLLAIAEKNALQATEDYLLKSAQDGDLAGRLAKLAGREVRRIECIDISHLGGDSTVGVSVVGEDGRFVKKDYKKYKIRHVGNNDVHAIKELMQRKMVHVEDGTEAEADLYLIDGGISQLNAAVAVLKEVGSESACLSISKSRSLRPRKHESSVSIEEIHSPGRKNPHKFRKNDAVLLYLQRMRDEAHRFAITYSRSLALKKRHVSPLLEIPGMGIKRAKALLTAMPDLYSRVDLTAEMIIAEAHLPAELARRVAEFVKE
jgi:excinuclease ABC subunit C